VGDVFKGKRKIASRDSKSQSILPPIMLAFTQIFNTYINTDFTDLYIHTQSAEKEKFYILSDVMKIFIYFDYF